MAVRRISLKDTQFPTGKEIDSYVILERIDLCAQYIDYLAVDKRTNKHVALKLLLGEIPESQENWKAYYQQTKIVAALEHPRFVPILYFSQFKGIDYVVTKFVDGYNFRMFLDEGHLITKEKALWFIKGTIDILSYAVRFNILHLNIRPVGFAVDWFGEIKAINLGFIQCYQRLVGHERFDYMRNPEHVAPEMIEGKPVDLRTDIYCLGATLFHLMTGYPPYESDMAQEICRMHIEAEFPKEKAIEAKVPFPWINLITRMMAKKPEDRYQNYRELSEDVSRIESGEATKIAA